LIRTIMAQAAVRNSLPPRTISFQGTVQTLEAFQPLIAMQGHQLSSIRWMFCEPLLTAITAHRVADRPDRIEPRQIKRRHKHYVPLSVSRKEAKCRIFKGLSKNQATFVDATANRKGIAKLASVLRTGPVSARQGRPITQEWREN
jgi:hypothetical protein